jgi:hypothetical protein
MKNILCLSILILETLILSAQTPPPNPDIQKLVVGSSPAYVLLGVQPDNIQKPSTPRDFIGGIQSAVVNGQLQPNFAIETNPFNWGNQKIKNQFHANDYFYSGWEAIKKNFSLSGATSSSDTVIFGKLQPGIALAYGLSCTIVPGKVNKITQKIIDQFYIWEINDVKSFFIGTFLVAFTPNKNNGNQVNFSKDDLAKFYQATIDHIKNSPDYSREDRNKLALEFKSYYEARSLETQIKYNNTSIADSVRVKIIQDDLDIYDSLKSIPVNFISGQTIPFKREGFSLNLSAATVSIFQGNQWNQAVQGKTAIWITPSYTFDLNPDNSQKGLVESIDVMAVGRFTWNCAKVDTANYVDLGLKLQFNRNAWNASFEWVARNASVVPSTVHSNWTDSWLGSFSYTINQITTLKFSFGSSFDGNTTKYTSPNQMFAVGGVNIGIF